MKQCEMCVYPGGMTTCEALEALNHQVLADGTLNWPPTCARLALASLRFTASALPFPVPPPLSVPKPLSAFTLVRLSLILDDAIGDRCLQLQHVSLSVGELRRLCPLAKARNTDMAGGWIHGSKLLLVLVICVYHDVVHNLPLA